MTSPRGYTGGTAGSHRKLANLYSALKGYLELYNVEKECIGFSLENTSVPSKLMNLIFVDLFRDAGTLSYRLTSMLSNLHFGKWLEARDMISFGFHVGIHILDIPYIAISDLSGVRAC